MAKQLYLIRHAEAETSGAGVKDFDRSLLGSGIAAASRLGKKILDQGLKIDKFISSEAVRASLTTEMICEQLQYSLNHVEFRKDIYESSVGHLLAIINNLNDDLDSVILVGHNPVLTHFAEYLTADNIETLPTAGIVAIELELNSWKEVGATTGTVKFVDHP